MSYLVQPESIVVNANGPSWFSHLRNLRYLELWIVPSSQSTINMMAAAVESFVQPLHHQLIHGLCIGLHDWKGRGDFSIADHSYILLDEALAQCTQSPERPLLKEFSLELSSSFEVTVGQVLEWFPKTRAELGMPLDIILFDEWYE
jgi:hypothetical protein